MAHVIVYLQRTTRGLHPGSAAALCLAREVADARGATVLSLCLGDAGPFDDRLLVEASRCGTDQVVFLGPEGIQKLFRRLAPRHVFAPYTRDAGSVLAQAGIGPMVGRWVDGPPASLNKLEPVIGVVAGGLAWQQAPMQIEPEYEADVTQVELASWLVAAAEQAADLTTTAEPPPLMYVDSPSRPIDSETKVALDVLGAFPIGAEAYANYKDGTLLWFDPSAEGLPLGLVERAPGLRVILLRGGGTGDRADGEGAELSGPIDSSWGMADFVLAGNSAAVVRDFNRAAWKSMFA
jgi:hypothetical protein